MVEKICGNKMLLQLLVLLAPTHEGKARLRGELHWVTGECDGLLA